jgi:hypothetical protein
MRLVLGIVLVVVLESIGRATGDDDEDEHDYEQRN